MSAPTVVQKKSRTKAKPVVRTTVVAKNIPAKTRPDPGIHAILNGAIQAKVQVGEPNDKYEKEADAVADKVMRMPEPKKETPEQGVQRQAEVNGEKQEEETAQRAEVEETKEEPEAQREEVEEDKEEPEAQRAEVEEDKQEPEAQRAEVEETKEEPEAQRAEVEETKEEPEAQREEVEEDKQEPEAQRAEVEEEQDNPEVQRQAEEGQQNVPAAAGGETAAAVEPTATGEGGGAEEGDTTEEEPWPEPTAEELESLGKAQRKASSTSGGNVDDPSVAQRINQPASGRPLSSGVRDYIEPRMGYDFSDVRVHDSPQDQADASAIRARAFTYGNHIWVGSNESADDRHLMAHELTHVVQQGDKAQRKLRRKAVVQQRTAGRKVQGGWWDRVTSAVSSAINAVSDLAGAALDAVLSRIAGWAENIPGFHLVTVILGKNPITDEVVERNATNVVRGVVGLIPGGEQFFQNLQESGALERAFNWLSTEIDRLNITWSYIKGLFRRAWDALELSDVMNPRRAFDKVARIFGPPLGRLLRFARNVGSKIMEFIVEGILTVMGPFGQQIMSILRRAQSVFNRILDDPIGFLRNLINAVKMGFNLFKTNIVAHLRAGLMGWLFGALQGAGLQIPEHFDLKGLISIVLQVLGLTYANLRRRLVRVLGERRVAAIERAVEIIRVIMTEGLAGAWRMILEYVGNLQSMVMGAIQNFVVTRIVQSAISYAISLFNPAGWVISAIRTIYNVVMFFVERWQQITALVNSVINSLDNIASGNIGPAAQYVEQTMARTLPVIISFLARLVGLGGISGHIRRFIQRVQRPVNRALDRIQAFIVRQARRLLRAGGRAVRRGAEAVAALFSARFQMGGQAHTLDVTRRGTRAVIVMRSTPQEFIQKIDQAKQRTTNAAARQRLDTFRGRAVEIETALAGNPSGREQARNRQRLSALSMQLQQFGADYGLQDLFPVDWDPSNELQVGTYGSLQGRGAEMTPDHEPQNSVMRELKRIRLDNPARNLVMPPGSSIRGYARSGRAGICLNMKRARHLETRTYGPSGGTTKANTFRRMGVDTSTWVMTGVTDMSTARNRVKTAVREAMNADHRQVRRIYGDPKWHLPQQASSMLQGRLSQVASQNTSAWPDVF